MKNTKSKNKGFTLIELMVVVLIIGILVAIALPQYRKVVAKAELSQLLTATKAVKQAQHRYYLIHNVFSTNINSLDIEIQTPNISCKGITATVCTNEKFALYTENISNYLECATKSTDENSPLVYACKNLAGESCHLSPSASTCLYHLSFTPCFVCQGNLTL